MQLIIQSDGGIHCVYGEDIDLSQIGRLSIKRGSHVEPDPEGNWFADLAPVNGPVLGPFPNRSQALQAEQEWLLAHWLMGTPAR